MLHVWIKWLLPSHPVSAFAGSWESWNHTDQFKLNFLCVARYQKCTCYKSSLKIGDNIQKRRLMICNLCVPAFTWYLSHVASNLVWDFHWTLSTHKIRGILIVCILWVIMPLLELLHILIPDLFPLSIMELDAVNLRRCGTVLGSLPIEGGLKFYFVMNTLGPLACIQQVPRGLSFRG
jgi:hypothetical protein